jgi:hypothetical protein
MVKFACDDVKSCGATSVGLVADDLRVSERGLLISSASTIDRWMLNCKSKGSIHIEAKDLVTCVVCICINVNGQ